MLMRRRTHAHARTILADASDAGALSGNISQNTRLANKVRLLGASAVGTHGTILTRKLRDRKT
jgi:hypothetical protein